jgi:hypothetical protein
VNNYKSIASINPSCLVNWDYKKNRISPLDITPNSSKKIWWKCEKNHEWEASPLTYTANVVKCPECRSENVPLISKTCPQILNLWDYSKNKIFPNNLSSFSNISAWWHCHNGHHWQMPVIEMARKNKSVGELCPICRSFGHMYPNLIKEIFYEKNNIDPFSISYGSNKKIWWKCEKGHTWESCVVDRTIGGEGCALCYELKNGTISDPLLLKEWNYKLNKKVDVRSISKTSGKKVWWRCSLCGNEWKTIINLRTKGCGCPKCASALSPKNEKSVFSVAPHLKKEWSPKNIFNPDNISYCSERKLWWICDKSHEWLQTPAGRISKNLGCPYCSGKKVCKDNSLKYKNPFLCKEWHYEKNGLLTPDNFTQFSSKRVWWLCSSCDHEWKTLIRDRSRGRGCPKCCKNVILKDNECCDSLVEALLYLKLKNNGIKFIHNKFYPGYGRFKFDFYIPLFNLYVEITGFNSHYKRYKEYLSGIQNKKMHVERNLKSNFIFIEHSITNEEKKYVKRYMKTYNKRKGL